jgi:hypothetical protein
MTRGIWLLTVSIVVMESVMTAQNAGRISGTLVSEDGAVVDHLEVCTSVTSGNSKATTCRFPVDNLGNFRIENVAFGTYGMLAVNEEQGYSLPHLSENSRPA